MPGSDGAVLCVLREGAAATVVPSDALAGRLQLLQLAAGSGPSLDALAGRRPVVLEGIGDGVELWRRAAVAAGVTGVLAVPVGRDTGVAATLTLYRRSGLPWPVNAPESLRGLGNLLSDVVLASSSVTPEPQPETRDLTALTTPAADGGRRSGTGDSAAHPAWVSFSPAP